MRRFVCLTALFLLAIGLMPPARVAAQPKKGPLSPNEALQALKVADGFQVELFAAEPMLINPTSIDVDHHGRVWVAEAVNYRRKNFGRPILRPEGDRIVVLVDEKGEGKATTAITFYQGQEIIAPLSVCVAPYPNGKGQKVFVCQSPNILVFEDKDGDLKADGPPTKFLTGFGGFDHDHGVHGLSIGPDGKLYFTVGDSGVNGLQSSNGKGRRWVSNSTDCRAGTVWRCDMDGTNLELIAHNFRNNYECCVDSFGEIWLSDNDDDGNQQTRICFVLPGGNYGYHPRGPGQTHWHEEQPGIVHKTLRTGFGSPTGITFYEGSLFGTKYSGALLHCDAGPREVRWFFRKPRGAGYELDKELLLTSSDNWFRPSDVCVAPDGSIFVADWYDRGVGGHGMGDPTDGRIYRITPKGHKGYRVPALKLDTPEGLLAALDSPCQATRWTATAAIRALKQDDVGPFFAWANKANPSPVLQVRLHWLVPQVIPTARAVRDSAMQLIEAKDDRLRACAFRFYQVFAPLVLDKDYQAPSNNVGTSLAGWSPAVRRELALWLRWLNEGDETKQLFYALAKLDDGSDHFYLAALNIACGTDPTRRNAILADFEKHFPTWNDKVANLVWELRPKSVLPKLPTLLADAQLTTAQKVRILDILAASDDPSAGQIMLEVLKAAAPAEVKTRAVESLKLFLPTKWKGLQNSQELNVVIGTLLNDEKSMIVGLQLVAAANATTRIDDVVRIARNDKVPFDCRQEAVRTLGRLPGDRSVEALIALGRPENPLSPACVEALGELLPKGPKPPKHATVALDTLIGSITSDQASQELKIACLNALAANRTGTIWLLDTHAQGKLPKELVAEAGRLLRNSPYQDLRNRALLAFPAPDKLNPKNLPAVAELAKRNGDAARGKAVWNASLSGAAQCAKCHMVRGVGGQVGPDLSMIGKKVSRENLYESILMPSKAIADQYLQHQVLTTAEVTVTGLLVADTPNAITLRDANGKDVTIPKKDIAGDVRRLSTSIMPQDIVAALTEDELIDLVAYLETLKVAAFTPDSFHIVGPFAAATMDAALDTEYGPEKGPFDPQATFAADPSAQPERVRLGWRTFRPDAKGYFNLAERHGTAATNSASYMYVEVESPADQNGEILLGPDDGARLWVNRTEVFVTRETKAAAPEQHKIAIKLVKGKNTILLKVANGNNPHGFYFSLTSPEEVKPMK